jgi:hypothetical protein
VTVRHLPAVRASRYARYSGFTGAYVCGRGERAGCPHTDDTTLPDTNR